MNKNWFNIKAESSNKIADIYIFDEIGAYGVTAQGFIEEIKAFKDVPIKPSSRFINNLTFARATFEPITEVKDLISVSLSRPSPYFFFRFLKY